MNNIYCYKTLFDYLTNIFCRNGKPLPANYVTGNKKYSDKFIFHSIEGDIHSKKNLKVFQGDQFFPLTFFEGEKTPINVDKKIFFCKEYTGDNARNHELLSGDNLPPLVPPNHLLQEEIIPTLYNKKKFDMRVLTCFSRDGHIMIYKNIMYMINPNAYIKNSVDLAHQFTAPNATKSKISFFEKVRPGELNFKNYINQLEMIIPKIYKKLIPIANIGYSERIENSYLIGGLDFISIGETDKLMFLEYNATPGYNIAFGIENWQEFYQLTTDFILGREKNLDDCIYISLEDFK